MDSRSTVNKSYMLIFMTLEFAPIEVLLKGTRLTENMLDEIESFDVADAITVVENLLAYQQDPLIAARYGRHLGVATHGPVGYAAVSAPTIGKAVETFFRWFQIRTQTYTPLIEEHDEYMVLTVRDTTGSEAFAQFFYQAFMRAFEVMLALLLGRAVQGETILKFRGLDEAYLELMSQEYDSTLMFQQSSNSLWVPKELWFKPSPLSDPDSHALNLNKCSELLAKQSVNQRIDLRVQGLIRAAFERNIQGGDAHIGIPQLEHVSRMVNLSSRTLIRRLSECGVSFRDLLESERRHFAEQCLADGGYTIGNISDALGYQESANFCRAFKRWTGCSPTSYRRQLRN